jgi:hypothetical protein
MTKNNTNKATDLFDEFLQQPDAWKILDRFYNSYDFGVNTDFNTPPSMERKTLWVLIGYALVFFMGLCAGVIFI